MKFAPMTERLFRLPALVLALLLATGCAVNPVTGERQLSLISESEERQLGQEHYIPTQQMQGGQFYLDPELTRYVNDVGQKLAAVSDRPDLPYEFVVLNSSVPNAWALPAGKIAINRGLLVQLEDEAQMASVLGHEIVHAAARHSVQRMQQGMLLSVGVAGLGIALADNRWAGLAIGGAAVGSQIVMARYSQAHELESDHYGIRYMVDAGYDPVAAVELQELFVQLSEGGQSSFLDGLFASHPPSQRRVEENRRLARELGEGGYRGREEYQRRIARAKALQPAYDLHDEAARLLNDNKPEEALNKINEAIRLEADEAAFHNLRGRIHERLNRPQQASADYDRAVSLYPEMFSYRIYRGLHELNLGNLDKARTDLQEANRFVPTSIAHLRLGDIAVRQGDRAQATRHYQQAAQGGGDIGEEARRKLSALQD